MTSQVLNPSAKPSIPLDVYSQRLAPVILQSLEPRVPTFPADCCGSRRLDESEMAEDPSAASFPTSLLADPNPPNLAITRIDFAKTDVPEFAGRYAVILDGVLTYDECKALVQAAEEQGNGEWERAMVNIGQGQQMLSPTVRNCGRIIWDSHELGRRLWARISSALPELQELKGLDDVCGKFSVRRGEVWGKPRLNERMRFLKYTGGEYFKGKLRWR
jgi:hypothetical protein